MQQAAAGASRGRRAHATAAAMHAVCDEYGRIFPLRWSQRPAATTGPPAPAGEPAFATATVAVGHGKLAIVSGRALRVPGLAAPALWPIRSRRRPPRVTLRDRHEQE